MLTVFWNPQGPILEHYQNKASTVYSTVKYFPQICSLRFGAKREDLSRGVVLLRNDVCARTVTNTLKNLCFEMLEYPSYSPDHTPSDYMFSPFEKTLRRWRFASDEEIKSVVQVWLATQL